jgi:hypothetical protein
MGLGNRNSHQVHMKAFPPRQNRLSHSLTLETPAFWHLRTSSQAWHRTRSLRDSEPMRGTVPPMTAVDRRQCPYWRRIRREQAVVSTSAHSIGVWVVVVVAEVVAEEVEREALAAAVPEAGSR